MTTIEERAKRICTNSFCNNYKLHKPICKTCIWRRNRELTELQCSVPEYKDAIESVYDSAICQLLLQREELTRWNDPNTEPPDNNVFVLIKATDGQQERIYLGSREEDTWMADGGYVFTTTPESVLGFDGVVIGWRPIHE